ncbi:MAG TPA: PLP-dependent aminotransferase family protein [Chloroflexi bacterium]|jgi:2-aminoadipate transaminase|nr:PLP-dependent aminotransferase family protein [Chloroflexota bacterium]
MTTNWQAQYARRLEWMTTSVIREILKVAQSPDTISMAGGWPDAGVFPIDQLDAVAHHVLTEAPQDSLQYGLTDGFPPLRVQLAEMMCEAGIPASMDNIAISSGSQQALDLVGRLFLDEGDTVLVESPTFLGALQSFMAYGPRLVGVPVDDEGLCVDEFERLVQETKPKFAYLLPTFHNPAGVTMSLERRRRVVEIADHYGVPIVEDDPYGQLRYEGEPLPSLAALDAERFPENAVAGAYVKGNVIYLGSFSKTLAPGLRVSWAVCPGDLAQQFVMAKQGADLHTSALGQAMASEFIRRGWLPAQVQRIRDTYRVRRDAMLEAIAEHFPEGVRHTHPAGGLFLWVVLPEGMDAVALLKDAAARKVAFVPGGPFYVDGGGANTLRLSFACMPPETIREGIRRLAEVIKVHMA